jgi:hypothetical protein
VATTPKGVDVPHGSVQGGGREYPHAWDLAQSLEDRFVPCPTFQLRLHGRDSLLQRLHLLPENKDHVAQRARQNLGLFLQERGQLPEEARGSHGRGDAELPEQGTHGIDPCRTGAHPLLSHAVQGENRLLIRALDRNRVNARTA